MAEYKKCPVTGNMCDLDECATWNCWIERKTAEVLPETTDILNGMALKAVNKLGLGTGQALKLAEKLSKNIAKVVYKRN